MRRESEVERGRERKGESESIKEPERVWGAFARPAVRSRDDTRVTNGERHLPAPLGRAILSHALEAWGSWDWEGGLGVCGGVGRGVCVCLVCDV